MHQAIRRIHFHKDRMLDKTFSPQGQSAFAARFEAQKIAFGPVVFQCVRYAWKRGMLQALADAGATGLSVPNWLRPAAGANTR
jgi:hypothetical protein